MTEFSNSGLKNSKSGTSSTLPFDKLRTGETGSFRAFLRESGFISLS